MAGLTRQSLQNAKTADWMVAEAVQGNRSPRGISLLTGKITGNFWILGFKGLNPSARTPRPAITFRCNSLLRGTGKYFSGTAISWSCNRDFKALSRNGPSYNRKALSQDRLSNVRANSKYMSKIFRSKGFLTIAQLSHSWARELVEPRRGCTFHCEQNLMHELTEDVLNGRFEATGRFSDGQNSGICPGSAPVRQN
jgi:hypothetical protein